MTRIITIDGPSGSGKGTISLNVADQLGWHMLDSGSLYRLTALACTIDGADFNNIQQVIDIARNLDVKFLPEDRNLNIFLRGNRVTDDIRAEDIGMKASSVAAIPEVREALLERQRAFAREPGLVADGRDMGTTVFPDAQLKIFMTASCEERAKRRHKQLKQKGISVSLADLVTDLRLRDEQDTNRSVSPLKPADDAIVLDTTEMSIEQVTAKLLQLAEQTFSV
jgi:cytidylate kinase